MKRVLDAKSQSWQNQQPVQSIVLMVTLLLAFFLLSIQLDAKSLWVDELFTARTAEAPLTRIPTMVAADLHPPLYFLLIRLWAEVAGTSEFALRWPSVLAGILSLCFTWQLGSRVAGHSVGFVAVLLLALSPFLVEFSRMARYYSLVQALGTLSTLSLLVAWKSNKIRFWALYGLVSVLLLYTFYLGIALLLAHGLVVMFYAHSRERAQWLACAFLVSICFLPWVAVVGPQIGRASAMTPADFAGGPGGLLLSLTYPFYAFSVGETIFPWSPTAIPAVLSMLVLVSLGVFRTSGIRRSLLIWSLILPVFLTAVTVTFISTGTPFLNAPVRAFFALPYFLLSGAIGWHALRKPGWRIGLGALIAITWAISLSNGYLGRQFLNPNYVIPVREIAKMIAERAGPQDLVVGEWDSGFSYYYRRQSSQAPYMEANQTEEVIHYITTHSPETVWLVTIGRDRTRDAIPTELLRWLQTNYRLAEEQGYVEQDPVYRWLKERLLHRLAYRYKLLVQRFERKW